MGKNSLLPTVKDVLMILGVTSFVTASLIFPVLPMAAKPLLDYQRKKQKEKKFKEWEQFNQARLRTLLKRLYKQKTVDFQEVDGQTVITLTNQGHKKVLSYRLAEIMINKPKKWDGKWRVIIYDIKKEKKILRDIFRRFLQKMQFLQLQKSVYLTPYPCDKEIEYLREYYGLGEEVLYLIVQKLENEDIYKHYFAI